jgi:hypothetical protein
MCNLSTVVLAKTTLAVMLLKKVLTVTFWVLAVPDVFETRTRTSELAGALPAPRPVIFGILFS